MRNLLLDVLVPGLPSAFATRGEGPWKEALAAALASAPIDECHGPCEFSADLARRRATSQPPLTVGQCRRLRRQQLDREPPVSAMARLTRLEVAQSIERMCYCGPGDFSSAAL